MRQPLRPRKIAGFLKELREVSRCESRETNEHTSGNFKNSSEGTALFPGKGNFKTTGQGDGINVAAEKGALLQ